MTLSDLTLIGGICTSILVPGGYGLKYYADHEYITVGSMVKRDIRELQSEILDLEYDRDHGGLSDKQEWKLRQLEKNLEEMKQELDN